MGAAASSSSSSKKYDVFISFRGDDTRKTFTSHLHTSLCLKGIETFIDYELPKGGGISQSLEEAIQNSSICVVVFSGRYATSKWCLNELLEILRCKQEQGQLVVPIFYQVDPSDVRHQRGAYAEAFAQHLKKNPDNVDEWRKALFETANLAGWHSCNCRDEAELIQNIVSDIIKKLNHEPPRSVLADIVGIEENLDHIELLLEGYSTIGIWGMSGIGKTTMARVVYTKLCSQFDSCCFLENLREKQVKHGLEYIRDQLFNELSKDTSLERLSRKKVFIVLDDVSNTSQLDYLKREAPPLGPGSKVIITSINKHVLDGRVDKIHKAMALSYHDSLKLFNLKAFHENGYKSEYKELVERAIAYAQGVPLVLTILGSFLHSKTVKEWESALRKVEMSSHQDIHPVLKVSYDGLDDEEKEIFLDIASFFKGESRESVIAVLDGCGFHTSIGLRNLMDKALISIDDYHNIQMHDLIQSMAFKIVCQQYKNPEGRSRLWNPDEIYDVLKRNLGTNAIEGICLDLSRIGDLQLSVDAFRKMTKLRILKFCSLGQKRPAVVNLPSGLESFSNSLSYLRWDNFPSNTLPLPFCTEKLVKLCMPNSHLEKLWDGI
ncbi:hypothetical protein QN277_019516 [Acacia crassicarpa]|uniref:TIR domain-containing protein n=1 Tax=Acacia crassicarpa TaxID=499986 RepID=A0AAE1MK42_9FABA|nr:hypothetical protein QN277_019516 [Acacia crassicarpa]